MKIILRILIGAGALLLISHFLPQAIMVQGYYAAFIAALLIGISNVTIRPLLLLFSLPLTLLTFGLFTVVIDAALLLFIGSIVEGFAVYGFVWAVIVAVLLSLLKYIGNKILGMFLD
jgi:putative membrane protein